MTESNPLGDVEITDPRAMRALAHPVRLAILAALRRGGAATATGLAPTVGATPSVTSWHLRHLARFGLVRDSERGADRRERRWEAVGRGFRFTPPADPADEEGRSAARALSQQMFIAAAEYVTHWMSEIEPALEPSWLHLAGIANTRVALSADELAHIDREMEKVIAPYVMRATDERPADARDVRLLRYFLPDRGAE